jgi:hypothetical protein
MFRSICHFAVFCFVIRAKAFFCPILATYTVSEPTSLVFDAQQAFSLVGYFSIYASDLREWLFNSRTEVGMRNYLGVGSGLGSREQANHISGVDSGVDFLLSV